MQPDLFFSKCQSLFQTETCTYCMLLEGELRSMLENKATDVSVHVNFFSIGVQNFSMVNYQKFQTENK